MDFLVLSWLTRVPSTNTQVVQVQSSVRKLSKM